ncbi:SDR family NAD(P)-dependent oxidoreductase [Streptosporangium sp. NBC_01755]|uniref:type I polyketide synthase n=1 Tax=Streptosporangium sp. NBC_01755 TaxID=2975949 RepID=UPI002DD806D4|nr:SDR family NAD(P)-dependent oxidoreductase [Streptosporangium sp. NBC_01755]WSC98584.1 SDR family NAD(P)-dependent oxidoreductase [Streptosporangium sp. NBC_01755]
MKPTNADGADIAGAGVSGADIAVVGIACRFPGARGAAEYWRLIAEGRRGISELTLDELREGGASEARLADPALVPAGGILWDADRFDAAFFGYSAREAALMDPQQRMFLEAAWHALDDTGHAPGHFPGTIGVYAGQTLGTHRDRDRGAFLGTSADLLAAADDKDFLSTRASYKLGLTGPSITVQAACSTSLVAIHLACRALITHDCDMALAGGVSWTPLRRQGYLHQEGGVWSADGHVRSFDRDASGFVPADGLGIVALRRLGDALADGDRVYAVVAGSAVTNDGSDKLSYAAPGVRGQQAAVEAALAVSGVDPDTVAYVEAHGTATALGDAVEVTALTRAYRAAGATGSGYCRLGSVKSNIGHTDAAAGVAGFIKAALMVHHGRIPPSPVVSPHPNPEIDFETSPFRLAAAAEDWPLTDVPRRAAVSSFGIGGTNAHVILEEPPPRPPAAPAPGWQLVALSARDETALAEMAGSCADALHDVSDPEFADLARTLAVGRRHLPFRHAGVFRDRSHAVAELRGHATGGSAPASAVRTGNRDVVFMFPGGGTRYPGMGRELYREEPVFRAAVDECLDLLPDRSAAVRLRALWTDEPGTVPIAVPDEAVEAGDAVEADEVVEAGEVNEVVEAGAAGESDPSLALPAVFVMEIALARLLVARGVTPSLLMGHSLGEYAAACVAGVMSLRDALAIVCKRGELLASLHDGAMLAVPASEREVEPFLGEGVCLSVVNGPESCVLAGPAAYIAEVRELLDRRGITGRLLPLSTAAHSALVDPVLGEFRDFLARITLRAPSARLISGVTGTGDADFADPEYWVTHLRATVRFDAALDHVLAEGPKILVEVGPGTTLSAPVRARAGTDSVVVNVTRHPMEERADREVLLRALARLWEAGVEVDLPSLWPERRLRLPAVPYPFAPTVARPPDPVRAVDSAASNPERSSDGLYGITWKRAVEVPVADPGPAVREHRWILLSDSSSLAEAIIVKLEEHGATTVVVTPGRAFQRAAPDRITIDPGCGEDYERLLKTAEADATEPLRIVCLWGASLPSRICPPLGHVVGLARALSGRPQADLSLVTRGALEITGGERLDPREALTIGAAGPLRHELADARIRLVDLDPGDGKDHGARAAELLAELCRPSGEDPTGLRAGHRWLRRFEPLRVTRETGTRIRRGGTYMITGGTSGIGLRLAEHLAGTYSARLVLIGRGVSGEFPSHGSGASGEFPSYGFGGQDGEAMTALLAGRGDEILVRGADVADARRLKEVLDEARSRFGEIHGVIHAAGVPGGGMAEFLTEEDIAAALRAKTEGTATLVSVLREVGALPDFVALFSSLASFSGVPGLTCYGAANAFLDTFALCARRDGMPVLSINWDRWNGVGMARDMERRHRELTGEGLSGGLSPKEGVAAFERCLAALPLGQVVVSSQPPGSAGKAPRRVAVPAARPRPSQPRRPAVPPADGTEEWSPRELELLAVWQDVLGVDTIGRRDDFFLLGGHSLSALQVVQRCKERFGVQLSVKALFVAPTIEGLAKALAATRADGEEVSRADGGGETGAGGPRPVLERSDFP